MRLFFQLLKLHVLTRSYITNDNYSFDAFSLIGRITASKIVQS